MTFLVLSLRLHQHVFRVRRFDVEARPAEVLM
jgi:hypothetical protein